MSSHAYDVIHEQTNNQSAQRQVLQVLEENLAVVKALQRTKLFLKEYSQKPDTAFRQATDSSSEEEKDG